MNIVRIKDIFVKDVTIELRQKYAVGGIALFAASVVFIMYKSFNNINPREWTILLWIIMLFAGLNAIVKSFLQEKKETYLYYFTLFDPLELIIARLLYNYLFMLLLFCVVVFFLSLFSGYPVKDSALFFGGSALGLFGISVIFTFVSVITASGQGNTTLMSVLALPLVLPSVLLLLKVTAVSVRLISDTAVTEDLWMLAGVDLLLSGVLMWLFPVLWKS